MQLLPAAGAIHGAMACRDGVIKGYGAHNWLNKKIFLSEYIGAVERHLASIKAGEWVDPLSPSGATHWGCINATTAIVLDAHAAGTLVDDLVRGCRSGELVREMNAKLEVLAEEKK